MIALDLVIVTYNRLEKLKKTLKHYENQTKRFRNLIVVNNFSNDGTSEFLAEWYEEFKEFEKFKPIIINTKENLGGSGGFYFGQKKAMELVADWVFVADDDAYADSTMIEEFYRFIELHDTSKVAAVCAEVLNIDGTIALQHRESYNIKNSEFIVKEANMEKYKEPVFDVNIFSYVGTFLNGKALKKYGLVNPDYFIYFDDQEHSIRMGKFGTIKVVPNIKITHEGGAAAESASNNNNTTWRDYYQYRNKLHLLIKHFPKTAIIPIVKQFKEEFHLFRTFQGKKGWHKLRSEAIWDAVFGRLGKHDIYRPGWKLE